MRLSQMVRPRQKAIHLIGTVQFQILSHKTTVISSSKIISAATFQIIGLTKIAKIKFLPLDWIYHSVRIMTV